jgi:cytoskeletal protein RodZ
MDELGTRLKQAREALGLPLKDIADRTKISVTALEALERNDLSRLPGGIFGRAFVRAYAAELGLNPDETVADFQAGLEEAERLAAERGARRVEITEDDRVFLERQRRAVRLLRMVVIGVAVVATLFLIWRFGGFWRSANSESPPAATAAP